MPRKKIKTKKTQLEAIQRYNARHDRITLTLPAGTKDRIAQITDKSINKFIADLICASLDNCTETKINRIDEDKTIYTDTNTDNNTNNIDTDIKQDTTDTIDTGTSKTDTDTTNVMDLFD